MLIEPGHVLAVKMNAHRHQWNGQICAQAQLWNCGAEQEFRANTCGQGLNRCFHIDVFKAGSPRFIVPDATVVHAVQQRPTLLDDQVLVFYGGRYGAQQGIAMGDYEMTLFGLYRVKRTSLDMTRTPHRILIDPHAADWAMFPRTHLRPPSMRAVPGIAYIKQLRAKNLRESIDAALDAGDSMRNGEGWTDELQLRLQRVRDALPQWLTKAEQAASKTPAIKETPRVSLSLGHVESSMAAALRGLQFESLPSAKPVLVQAAPQPGAMPSRQQSAPANTAGFQAAVQEELLQDSATSAASPDVAPHDEVPDQDSTTEVVPATNAHPAPAQTAMPPMPVAVTVATAAQGAVEPHRPSAIPEPAGRVDLVEQFGQALVDALSVAFVTKNLVILTGAPGAGKSWIASRLLDDPQRERTVIVPVASTWRGREDLLGYINPVSGCFEATELTLFLCDAQQAWEAGDQRTRLVVFEEFNLSQPEHWLSDLLVRLEYEAHQLQDRSIRLGGKEISGRPGSSTRVVLTPNVRFVATLNNDHTVKPLSPRVLDRSALIEVSSSGRGALSRIGIELSDDLAEAVDEINDLLESRGAAFSVRSARSLQRAIEASGVTGIPLKKALDLVLAQEVLSRVRLLAGDPRDAQLLALLQTWTQKPGCEELTCCATRISAWTDILSSGRDVFQA